MRVIGYIDGLNFYEASKNKEWYPAGWCNWTETLSAYCPGAEVSVRYFTALYAGRDERRAQRQRLHLLAMKEVAGAKIIYGSSRERPTRCQACRLELQCQCGCDTRFVEKMTDVNIAIRMLEDAVDGLFDRAYLMTADVDLVPAIDAVLRRARDSQVIALLPPESVVAEEFANLERAWPRRAVARHLNLDKLRRFPDDLPLRWGMRLPEHWREHAGRRPLSNHRTRRAGPFGGRGWKESA
jgi:uncharacterized LabA/DUF88 family protein